MPRKLQVPLSLGLVADLKNALVVVKTHPRQYSPQAVRNLAILIAVGEGCSLEAAAANMVSKQYVSEMVRRVQTGGINSVIAQRKLGRNPKQPAAAALLAEGISPNEIATRLNVCLATVHRARKLVSPLT